MCSSRPVACLQTYQVEVPPLELPPGMYAQGPLGAARPPLPPELTHALQVCTCACECRSHNTRMPACMAATCCANACLAAWLLPPRELCQGGKVAAQRAACLRSAPSRCQALYLAITHTAAVMPPPPAPLLPVRRWS